MNRSKTIQKAIEQQNLLEETYKNDTTNSRPSSTTSGESSSPGDLVDVADGPIVPPEPEPKELKRTLSNQSDYDIPVASKTAFQKPAEDPYDLPQHPRIRLESDYDLLPPTRKAPVRTFSEDDYDVLPVRKESQFSQNNNNDDDDYDELPPAPQKPATVAYEDDDYDELPPVSSKTLKPAEEDDDDYDELPVRKAKISVDEDEYDIPKGHAE